MIRQLFLATTTTDTSIFLPHPRLRVEGLKLTYNNAEGRVRLLPFPIQVTSYLYFDMLGRQLKNNVNIEKIRNEELSIEIAQLQDTILTRKAQLELSVLNSRKQILLNKKVELNKRQELQSKQEELLASYN